MGPFNPCGGSAWCPGTAILSRAGSWSMYPYSKVVMEAKIPCGGRHGRGNRPDDGDGRLYRLDRDPAVSCRLAPSLPERSIWLPLSPEGDAPSRVMSGS